MNLTVQGLGDALFFMEKTMKIYIVLLFAIFLTNCSDKNKATYSTGLAGVWVGEGFKVVNNDIHAFSVTDDGQVANVSADNSKKYIIGQMGIDNKLTVSNEFNHDLFEDSNVLFGLALEIVEFEYLLQEDGKLKRSVSLIKVRGKVYSIKEFTEKFSIKSNPEVFERVAPDKVGAFIDESFEKSRRASDTITKLIGATFNLESEFSKIDKNKASTKKEEDFKGKSKLNYKGKEITVYYPKQIRFVSENEIVINNDFKTTYELIAGALHIQLSSDKSKKKSYLGLLSYDSGALELVEDNNYTMHNQLKNGKIERVSHKSVKRRKYMSFNN